MYASLISRLLTRKYKHCRSVSCRFNIPSVSLQIINSFCTQKLIRESQEHLRLLLNNVVRLYFSPGPFNPSELEYLKSAKAVAKTAFLRSLFKYYYDLFYKSNVFCRVPLHLLNCFKFFSVLNGTSLIFTI